MNDIECPYCDAPNEVCHDDGQGYEEGKAHEMQCCECKKYFVFHTSVSFYYSPEKADCLNGTPHRYSEWRRLWDNKAFAEMLENRRCRDCDHTEERWVPKSPPSETSTNR